MESPASNQSEPETAPLKGQSYLSWLGCPKARNHILEYYLECQEPDLRRLLQEWLRVGRSDYPQHAWPFVAERNPPPYRFALISPDGLRFFYFPWADSDAALELKISERNRWVRFPEVIRLNGSMNRRELWRILLPTPPFLGVVLEKFSATVEPDIPATASPSGKASVQGGESLEAVIAGYQGAGEKRDAGSFTLTSDYRKRFLATKCSRSPYQTILDRWKDLLQRFGDAATVELLGGGFRPVKLTFWVPAAIQECSFPPGGELFDLLVKSHGEADPLALTLSALIKALFEKGARKVTWRCCELETLYRPDGSSSSKPIRAARPELSVKGLSWREVGELESALRQVYPSSSDPWDSEEPTVYLQGEFGLEQGPWPMLARPTTVKLDRPFSLLIYLHNATGHFPNGSIRFFWPGGQFKALQQGTLPADIIVISSSPPQRDPSLQRLSDPHIVEDVRTLAVPYISQLLSSLKHKPLSQRIHYFAVSLRLQDLSVRSYHETYWQQLMDIPVFKTVTGRELSIREACQALKDQGFLGEVENLETVCPSIKKDYLFRNGEFPNLFSQQIGVALSKVDGTRSPFQTLRDLTSALDGAVPL